LSHAHAGVLQSMIERMVRVPYISQSRCASKMRLLVITLLVSSFVTLFMTACDSSTAIKTLTPTPTKPASPTTVATLPPLTAEKGWHIVLTLGNTSATSQTFAGSFLATKPYKLFYTCKGSGTLHITYPRAAESSPCTGTPELNGTSVFQPPSGNHSVTVSATTEGTVEWQAIVEMQD
jgi:hypothetical protein